MNPTAPAGLKIRPFSDDLAGHFHDINAEWISDMFTLEATDQEVLRHPRKNIIDAGGDILFVEAAGVGIVGTCALQKTGEHSFELTKMGVRAEARGLKAGEFLLAAVIERARALGADPLYLLSNAKCEAAIHLYEKAGFRHDADIMARYGARYQRCNVAMRYPG
jgi:N-acetylglutamate synthase-like GNAT family acetyltransferase